jgi:uncharacterized protein YdeI (BOF family)
MNRVAICTLIALFFLAACGGSDGGLNGENTPPPAADFVVNANNAMAAISAAYGAAAQSGDFADLVGSTGLTANKTSGSSKTLAPAYTNSLLGQIVQQVPLGTDVYDCVTGTVSVTIDVVDPLALAGGAFSVGDNILVDYDNCDEGNGEVIDGTIDMTVSAFDGNIFDGFYDLSMTMIVTMLQVTTEADVLTSDGDATARLNLLDLPYAEATVSGNSMTMDYNASSDTLADYESMQTIDSGAVEPPYTMATRGTLTTTRLAGSITYSTPVTFAGIGSSYPHTGEFLVAGENSSARLVVDSDVDVHIDVDSNGDGAVDQTIVTTWAELASM